MSVLRFSQPQLDENFYTIEPDRYFEISDIPGGNVVGMEEDSVLIRLIRSGGITGKVAQCVLCRWREVTGNYPSVLDAEDIDSQIVSTIRGRQWQNVNKSWDVFGREGRIPYDASEIVRLHDEILVDERIPEEVREAFFASKTTASFNAAARGDKDHGENGHAFYSGRIGNVQLIGHLSAFSYVRNRLEEFFKAKHLDKLVIPNTQYRSSWLRAMAMADNIWAPSGISQIPERKEAIIWDRFGQGKIIVNNSDQFDANVNDASVSVTRGPLKGCKIVQLEIGGVRLKVLNVLDGVLADLPAQNNVLYHDHSRAGPDISNGRHTLSWNWGGEISTREKILNSPCAQTFGAPDGSEVTIH